MNLAKTGLSFTPQGRAATIVAPRVIIAIVIVLSILMIVIGSIILATSGGVNWGLPFLFAGIAMGLTYGATTIAYKLKTFR